MLECAVCHKVKDSSLNLLFSGFISLVMVNYLEWNDDLNMSGTYIANGVLIGQMPFQPHALH